MNNHDLADNFLTILESEIRTNLAVGSFIIFNDINSINKGRDDFDRRIGTLLNAHTKYFYNVQSAGKYPHNGYGNYIEIPYTHNICQLPQYIAVNSKLSVMQTVIFVYGK